MRLPEDLKESIASLDSHHVEYVIMGPYALAYHGHPRHTGDVDILVGVSPENAARVEEVLREFGGAGLSARDFLEPEQVIPLGRARAGQGGLGGAGSRVTARLGPR